MPCGKTNLIIFLIVIAFALPYSHLQAAGNHEEHKHDMKAGEAAGTGQSAVFAAMPEPGQKVQMGNGDYLIYGFDKKPKMGTVILKVRVFNSKGEKNTTLMLLADSGMPSMKGAHETGDQPLRLSQKGEYLIPINIVMPGDWEIRLTVKKGDKVLFRGSYKFDV